MAKTMAGVAPKYTAEAMAQIPEEASALIGTFASVCSVAGGEADPGFLAANADRVFDLAVFGDRLADISKMIREALEASESIFSESNNGEPSKGFKWKNNGSTTTVTDAAALRNALIAEGCNVQQIDSAMSFKMKELSKATGFTEERMKQSYPECFEIKPKKASLQRTSA